MIAAGPAAHQRRQGAQSAPLLYLAFEAGTAIGETGN
jgi:hypothetical protein